MRLLEIYSTESKISDIVVNVIEKKFLFFQLYYICKFDGGIIMVKTVLLLMNQKHIRKKERKSICPNIFVREISKRYKGIKFLFLK